MASDRKDTPAMRARTEYAYSNEVYGTLQRMLAKLLEAMPEKVRFTHRHVASFFQHSCMLLSAPSARMPSRAPCAIIYDHAIENLIWRLI